MEGEKRVTFYYNLKCFPFESFYFYVIYSCKGKAEFSAAITPHDL